MNFRARNAFADRRLAENSRSDVTTLLCPDPHLRSCGPFGTRLQRGIKIQGFDQIQKFSRRSSHQSMTIFLGGKKI